MSSLPVFNFYPWTHRLTPKWTSRRIPGPSQRSLYSPNAILEALRERKVTCGDGNQRLISYAALAQPCSLDIGHFCYSEAVNLVSGDAPFLFISVHCRALRRHRCSFTVRLFSSARSPPTVCAGRSASRVSTRVQERDQGEHYSIILDLLDCTQTSILGFRPHSRPPRRCRWHH